MTEGLLGAAYVEVLPRLDRFGPDLNRQLRSNLGPSTFAPMESAAANAGKLAGRQSGGFFAKRFSSAVHAAKIGAGLAVALGIGTVLRTGFQEAKDAAAGQAQLAAGIRSTHNAARVTVPELEKLATRVQDYSGQTDDSIVATEKLLLTFVNIRNGAGKTNQIFTQTVKVAADMAARMGGDASGAAIQLGKALNDPVKGLSALTRVGVSFDQGQKDRIKRFVEEGHVVAAQKIELKELNKEFGGSAKAAGEVLPGKIEILKRKFEDFSQSVVEKVIPVVMDFIDGLTGTGKKTDAAAEAGRNVAQIWRQQVYPALQKLGEILQTVGEFIVHHKTLVEGLVIAYAGLKTALAIGGAVNRAKTALGGLGTVLGKKGGASGGTGLIGGLSAMGPVGIGAAAAIGVVGFGMLRARANTAKFNSIVDTLAGTLDTLTGATTRQSRAAAAKILQDTGGLDLANKYGISLRDATSAALGNERAQRRVMGALTALHKAHKISFVDYQVAIAKIGNAGSAMAEARRKTLQLADAIGNLGRNTGGLGAQMATLGRDMIDGLVAGLRGGAHEVTVASQGIAQSVIKNMRYTLDAKSPSTVAMGIGSDVMAGLGKGILLGVPSVNALSRKAASEAAAALGQALSAEQAKLSTLRGNRSSLVSSLTSGLSGGADLSGLTVGPGPKGTTRVGQTSGFLANYAAKLKTFVRLLVRTRRLGLMPGLLDQIAQLGPDQGIPILRDIDAGGRAGIAGVNASERQILRISSGYARGQGNFELGGKIDATNKRLDLLHDDLEAMRKELKKHPEKTGQHVGDALNGTAHRAHLAARGRMP